MNNEKWKKSFITGILAFLPAFGLVMMGIFMYGNVDGLGGVIGGLMFLQGFLIVFSLEMGHEAMEEGDVRGVYGIILGIISVYPTLFMFFYNATMR